MMPVNGSADFPLTKLQQEWKEKVEDRVEANRKWVWCSASSKIGIFPKMSKIGPRDGKIRGLSPISPCMDHILKFHDWLGKEY